MTDDQRLIEDLIPVDAINDVAQKEKIGHAGNPPAQAPSLVGSTTACRRSRRGLRDARAQR